MRLLLGVVTALVTLLPAATASAATLTVEDGVLTYTAEPGEYNDIDVWSDPDVDGLVYVAEYEPQVDMVGSDCLPVPEPFALTSLVVWPLYHCSGVESVAVDLGDEGDWAFVGTDQATTIDGGDGNDEIHASYVDDTIDGGAGDDIIEGGPGNDTVAGGPGADRVDGDYVIGFDGPVTESEDGGTDTLDGGEGDDLLRGGAKADVISGGAGSDTADYSARTQPVVVTLAGGAAGAPGEGDSLAGIENALTGGGDDTVTGDAVDNTITTGAGADTVDPGAGADKVSSGAGADTIALRDGAADAAECGEGLPDTVTADAADIVGGDCEAVDKPAGPVAGAPQVRPSALRVRAALRRAVLRVRGRLTLPAGTPCTGLVVRLAGKAGKRPLRLDVPLDVNCNLAATLPVGARKITLRATFAGTQAIAPIKSRRVKVRR